ncbi:hypothetical protein ACP26L_30080 [Paenibacillus sp. S-38]|uniref:hypothetical protein n=1 Tax=Paenibacillus sp. S-38 TaxID=3416710 RepID=UPI003CF133D1
MSHTVSLDIRSMMQQLGIHPERVTEILTQVLESSSSEEPGSSSSVDPDRQPLPIL